MPLTVQKSKSRQSLAGYINADGSQNFVIQYRHTVVDPETGAPGVTLTLQKQGPNGMGEKVGFATAIPADNPVMLATMRQKAVVIAAKAGLDFASLRESEPVRVEQDGKLYDRYSWLVPSAEVLTA